MRHSLLLLLHTACNAGTLSGTLSGPSLDDTALPSDGGGDDGGGDGADGGDEGGDDTAPPTPRCEPEITLPTPWYTEGDAISLPIACTSGAMPLTAWYLLSCTSAICAGRPATASVGGP